MKTDAEKNERYSARVFLIDRLVSIMDAVDASSGDEQWFFARQALRKARREAQEKIPESSLKDALLALKKPGPTADELADAAIETGLAHYKSRFQSGPGWAGQNVPADVAAMLNGQKQEPEAAQ